MSRILDQPSSSKPSAASLRKPKLASTAKMLAVFRSQDLASHLEAGLTLISKRRVSEFSIAPGKLQTKITTSGSQKIIVALNIPPFSKDIWQKAVGEMSKRSLFLSSLLVGHLPFEIEDIFQGLDKFLYPEEEEAGFISREQLQEISLNKAHVAALYYRTMERFDSDPCAILQLRGLSREHLVNEMKLARSSRRTSLQRPSQIENEAPENQPLLLDESFWSMQTELDELSFDLKADELPAAILKRLEPLPLQADESDLESALDDAYETVARRAQVYGLGFRSKDS